MNDATTEPCGVDRRDGGLLALLLVVWAALCLLAAPFGEFPLNDDWSYAATVKTLVEQGRYVPGDWTSMPLLLHALWGALFCLPAGFSFLALRLSTAVAGAAAIALTHALVREAGAGAAAPCWPRPPSRSIRSSSTSP